MSRCCGEKIANYYGLNHFLIAAVSVLQHGVNCRTHTFPTKCNHCGDDVYFFSCTCGSRVFFDKLGWPWPEHDCAFSRSDLQWAKGRSREKLADGGVRVKISEGVTATRRGVQQRRPWNIDSEVEVTAKREIQMRQRNPIEYVPPGADWAVEITGVLRELKSRVDVYQRLGLPRNAMTKGFLGELGNGEWGRVTIHELKSTIYSYTAWIPASLLPSGRLRTGATVSVTLQRFDIADKAREWVCSCFYVE